MCIHTNSVTPLASSFHLSNEKKRRSSKHIVVPQDVADKCRKKEPARTSPPPPEPRPNEAQQVTPVWEFVLQQERAHAGNAVDRSRAVN